MSALPRPDLTGPARTLNDALHDLHHRAGWPSLRTLAKQTGVSHTTVSKVFSTPALPTWGTLELLVEAMDGDPTGFRSLWLAASSPADVPLPGSRIAGRRAELDAVRRHLEAGTGLLLVTGEAGMGKTTVVRAAAEDTGTLVAVGHCLPLSTDVPLLAVADCLRSLVDADPGGFARALDACPPYVAGSLASLVPEAVPGASAASDDRQLLFAAVGAVVRAVAAGRPAALLLEDLHWADPVTLDLLEHLLGRGTTFPVVGTWRSGEDGRTAGTLAWRERVRRLPATTVLGLGPLTRAETSEQLRLLGAAAGDRTDRIHERSQGQPLFTEQLAAYDDGDPGLPDLLADLLDRRLEGLTDDGWDVVRTLGVASRPLAARVLAQASGLGEQELTPRLRELRSRHLLRFDGEDVELQHPLLAEAVRRRTVAGEDMATHRAIAAALATASGAEPAEVAAHWQDAGSQADELVWRIRAAEAAAARLAASQAADHWLRVLVLWPAGAEVAGDPPVRRFQALAGLAREMDRAGRPTESEPWLEEAVAEPAEFEVAERAELLHLLARTNSSQFTSGDRGLALIEKSVALFRTTSDAVGLAGSLNWMSTELEWHGRREEATAAIMEAADVAVTSGDRILERGVRAQRAWQLAVSGHPGAVDEIAALVEELPGGHDPERDLAVGIRHTDILLMACRPADEVAAAARRDLEVAERWELDSHRVKILKGNVSQALRRAGRVGEAHALVRSHTEVEDPGEVAPFLHTERAVLDVLRGAEDEARRRIGFLEVGRFEFADGFIAEAVMLDAVWDGRPEDALACLETVLESRHDEFSPGVVGDLMALAARSAADLAAGAPAPVRRDLLRRLEALRGHLHHDPFGSDAVLSDREAEPQWAAELSRLAGAAGLDTWIAPALGRDELLRPHDAAYCRWRAAQCALRDGQGTVAARLLRKAATDAREHVPLSEAISTTAATGR